MIKHHTFVSVYIRGEKSPITLEISSVEPLHEAEVAVMVSEMIPHYVSYNDTFYENMESPYILKNKAYSICIQTS